jgi:hypothetical protein
MGNEKMITEREAVLRERKAFAGGARAHGASLSWTEDYAKVVYPLPVSKRPLRVTLSDGSVWSLYRTRQSEYWRWDGAEGQQPYAMPDVLAHVFTAADFRQIARMLDGEMEDVPEEEG